MFSTPITSNKSSESATEETACQKILPSVIQLNKWLKNFFLSLKTISLLVRH